LKAKNRGALLKLMPSPRIPRLLLDEQMLQNTFENWPTIQITVKAGVPAEIYRFTYNLRGLYVAGGGEILERETHLLEVNLTLIIRGAHHSAGC
jgi:hypothetical protein